MLIGGTIETNKPFEAETTSYDTIAGDGRWKFILNKQVFFRPPLKLLPVLGPLEQWCDAYTWRSPAV